MDQDKTFLGTEPIGKLLRKLAVPTVIAQLVNMLYNIVDRIYIGHIPGDGDLALTGVGVCLPLILIVSAFAALVASGGAPRASIYMGKQDHDTAEKILGGCFALQLAVSALLTAVLLLWRADWPAGAGMPCIPSLQQLFPVRRRCSRICWHRFTCFSRASALWRPTPTMCAGSGALVLP